MPESFFVIRRVPMMKMVLENAAWRARSVLWVVEPHSMSTVPFCTSGMRLVGVVIRYLISIFCKPAAFCAASATFRQMSLISPIGSALPLTL